MRMAAILRMARSNSIIRIVRSFVSWAAAAVRN